MRLIYNDPESTAYEAMLPHIDLAETEIDVETLSRFPGMTDAIVTRPDTEYRFLHEAAVIAYRGVLFAAWYNCPARELSGNTPIRGSRSFDGGKTWTKPEVIAVDNTGKLLYCPPVFGICDGVLYMLCNTMVGADHIHSMDFYRWEEAKQQFVFFRSDPMPFKLNTNVCTLPNGKLMLPGRIAEMDSFPNTPAVLISDSGKIDAPWRLVRIAPDGNLADGSKLCHPELSAIIHDGKIYMFCRDDERQVPLLYVSEDSGETWSGPYSHNIPFCSSKIYSGTLSNGVNYVIGSFDCENCKDQPNRADLSIFFSEPGTMRFTKAYNLHHGSEPTRGVFAQWHYPVCYEADGNLYVIYTMNSVLADSLDCGRGAMVSVLPLKKV